MRLNKLLVRQAGILARIQEIEQAAGDKALTDEQRAELKSLRDESKVLAADIAEARATQELERSLMARQPVDENQREVERQAAEAQGRVEVGADRSAEDPKRGFKDHREFLSTVMQAGRNPARIDRRLLPLQAAQGSDEQGAYSDPHGGFLVPHGVAPGILTVEPEGDFLAPLVRNVTMTAPTVSYNARVDKDHTTSVSGGFTVTRHPETVDASASRTKFEQVTLTANEEFGLAFATERILTDSPQSFVDIIAAGFADEYAANAIRERLSGSGVGERMGILNAPCLVTVSKESGQAADTIVTENIDKMAARCWRYSRAVYLANHDTRPQLRGLVRKIGTAGESVPYFTQSTTGQELLDGRPIYFTEFAEKLGDKGDLILGVWSEYLEGEYQQLQTAESIHVRFAAAERCFRFYRRNDGQPWWKSALTPRKSSDTLSPFVVLQAR
jgi:HK97 family phage major capsid protein